MSRPEIIDRRRRRGPLRVVAFRSYGSPSGAVVRGRVLANRDLSVPEVDETRWRTMGRSVRRFLTREVAGIEVEAALGADPARSVTDAEGYFSLECPVGPHQTAPPAWITGSVRLPGRPASGPWPIEALIVDPATDGVIISDIDDTVLASERGNPGRTLWITLTGSALTRLPVPGAADLYRRLASATTRGRPRPVFYVSSSPWNLYGFLTAFLDRNGFPKGPLVLRDVGVNRESWASISHRTHKVTNIESILASVPAAKAVLFGDSSQEDAAAFAEVMEAYPHRIAAAYIRDLGDPMRSDRVRRLIDGLASGSSPMVLATDTATMAEHAERLGLVAPRSQRGL